MDTSNELKIVLYPEKEPLYTFEKKPISDFTPKNALDHSLKSKSQFSLY